MGANTTPEAQASLDGWGRFVAAILQGLPDRAILVGHSLGGMAISQASEYAPDRIATLVYATALLPRDGLSALDLTRGGDVIGSKDQMKITPSADGRHITADPASVRSYLYGETEESWAARALSLLVPQPLAIMMTPARLTTERFGATPRIFIECLRDRVIPLQLQRAMQAASPCGAVFAIDTDHSPFYSAHEALVGHLLTIAAQTG
jgi:pimeloyl-ACP methyl ester carboxylesterase